MERGFHGARAALACWRAASPVLLGARASGLGRGSGTEPARPTRRSGRVPRIGRLCEGGPDAPGRGGDRPPSSPPGLGVAPLPSTYHPASPSHTWLKYAFGSWEPRP